MNLGKKLIIGTQPLVTPELNYNDSTRVRNAMYIEELQQTKYRVIQREAERVSNDD